MVIETIDIHPKICCFPVYPRDIIEIKKKDPFDIIISDSEEEYYIYPPMSIKQEE